MSLFSLGYVALLGVMWASAWGVGNRQPRAWLWSVGARLGLVVWSTLMHVAALVPIALAFVVVEWRNYVKWRKEADISRRIADSIMRDEENEP